MHSTERAWCPECRTMRDVAERSDEGHYERHGEVTYTVTWFTCDHFVQGVPQVIGVAPGAPYAGPGRAVAANTSLAALAAAARRQEQIDPPHGDEPW